MEKKIDTDEYLETLDTSNEYPSDADVEEAKNLKVEVSDKHKRLKKKLDERLRKQNQEDSSKSKLELEKSRLSSSLGDAIDSEPLTAQQKRRMERRAKRLETQEHDSKDYKDSERPRRKSHKHKEKRESSEPQDLAAAEEVAAPVIAQPKHIDRAAIAATLREKRKREKEAELTESLRDAGTDDSNVLRSTMDKHLSTRFDVDAIGSARYPIVPEPELTWDALKQQEMITEKQAYDFFCKKWPEVPKPAEKAVPVRPESQEGAGAERRDSHDPISDTAKLIERPEEHAYTGVLKNSRIFLERKPARKIPTSEVLAREEASDMLFVPGPVDMTFFEQQQPLRNFQEEGLYVGRRPFINSNNERRLSSRIQRENQMDWFGEDGRLKILPDPLKEIPFRPLMWNEQFNPMPAELQTENFKPIVSSITHEQVASGDLENSFQMIITLHSLEFTHHHLFSFEHVLAQRIKHLFLAYDYIGRQEGMEFFQQRILSLKHAIGHLNEKLKMHEGYEKGKSSPSEVAVQIESYRQEIRNTRTARNNEEAYLRRLKTCIIKTWKQIKEERARTGMALTEVAVKIKKQAADADEDRRLWERDVAEQVAEEREHYERHFNSDMRHYAEQKALYERQRQAKAAARARQQAQADARQVGKERTAREMDDTDYLQEVQDLKALGEPDLGEPVLPTPFDEQALAREIRATFEQCRRLPGEAHIHPVLKFASPSDENLSKDELNRRNTMLKYRYFAELFFNNKKVVTTDTRELNQDFTVRFNENIPIIISQYPEIIILKLYENSGFSSKLLGSLEMDVPLPYKVSDNDDLETYSFKTNQILVHKNCGVGSGEKSFQLESIDGTPSGEIISPLFTSGLIYGRTVWAIDNNGDLMIPMSYINSEKFKNQRANRDPLLALGFSKILDLQRRQEWKSIESHLDPNDPRDAKVIKALHTNEELGIDPGTKLSSDYFRLNPHMDEFAFSTVDDLDRSLRFRMIRLRNNNVPEFRFLPIPLYDDKVPMELIKEYELRKGVHKKKVIVTGFEARKLMHQEFIEKIRDEVLSKFRSSLLKKSLVEMVREDEIPAINDIFPKLLNLNRFNRPLQRLPEPRKPISVHNVYEMDVEIVIVIQRASNLPVDIERRTLTPFVQVNFQNMSRHTDVLEGMNPAWDTELRLPFKPPTSVTSLDTVKDTLLINVYDQQVINMSTGLNAKFNTVHERYERHWLGSLEIPFNTLYLNSKIEGNFLLKQPAFVQGYERVDSVDPMLSVFITLDPEIHPPQSLKERFSSVEDRDLITHIENWQNQMNLKFPKRFRRVTVVNMRCQETLITRYISCLEPPSELLQVDESVRLQMVARFVSLISFMADALVFPGISDIWSTCDQFLKMLIGDEDEHAVLLCNYFNHLYKSPNSVYLCLGEAIPEGSTAYVLTKESNGDVWLWNASTGTRFKSTDTTCSLFKVGLLVNQHNVWANTQQRVQPWEIHYDLAVRSEWLPLFKSDVHLQTVQPDAIIYEAPYLKEVQDFQLTLENQLRNSMMDWRMGLHTSFLIAPRREMVEILKALEANCGQTNEAILSSIKAIMPGYRAFGFPIHLPYMEVPDVLARVEATGIHLTADPRVEFAIAVYIKAYANTVLSIWIYVASLVRN